MKLENAFLRIEIAAAGAELMHIFDLKRNTELLFDGDPAFWKRRAPVLFPNVGKTYNNIMCIGGESYPTGQYVLAIPSGLVEERDLAEDDPLASATVREVFEETGVRVGEGNSVGVVNPLLFCTPGLTDECTALMCVVVRRKDRASIAAELTQDGAEGGELFDGFDLLTRDEAWGIIREGRDAQGRFYPMVAWTALMWFATDQWKS